MLPKQKVSILKILKSNEAERNYVNNYLFPYKDFLDPTDGFTAFECENLDGKQEYIDLIENLCSADETAQIFVQVYGFEEYDNEQFIYADTLIIFRKLPLVKIKQIFNEPKDIFPSDIGEVTDFSRQEFIVDDNGDLAPVSDFSKNDYSVYYCWWD